MERKKAITLLFNGAILTHPLIKDSIIYFDEIMLRPVIKINNKYDWDIDPFMYRHKYVKIENNYEEI